jgi:predicted acetyltransferase
LGYLIRQVSNDDWPAAAKLAGQAFGHAPPSILPPATEATVWGVFDSQGRVIGQAKDLHHHQYWNGDPVTASGLASVVIAPELRGHGIGKALLRRVVLSARERGAVVCNLFPTYPSLYRSMGWEIAGSTTEIVVPALALRQLTAGPDMMVESGGSEHASECWDLFDVIARSGRGLITKSNEFAERLVLADGLTLVRGEDNRIVGYASWIRGHGYGPQSELLVREIFAANLKAAKALLAALGGWFAVAGRIRIPVLPWADPIRHVLDETVSELVSSAPWMIRPLDICALVEAQIWPSALTIKTRFRLIDHQIDLQNAVFEVDITSGRASMRRVAGECPWWITVQGWGLLWSGRARCKQARSLGLMGGDASIDGALDLAFAGLGPVAIGHAF